MNRQPNDEGEEAKVSVSKAYYEFTKILSSEAYTLGKVKYK